MILLNLFCLPNWLLFITLTFAVIGACVLAVLVWAILDEIGGMP